MEESDMTKIKERDILKRDQVTLFRLGFQGGPSMGREDPGSKVKLVMGGLGGTVSQTEGSA